jgi:cAMP phosphodiesterase
MTNINLSIDPIIGDNVIFNSGDPLKSYIFNDNIYPSMTNVGNKSKLTNFLS